MDVESKKAFWINIYNALVLHGGLAVPPVQYIFHIFFNKKKINVYNALVVCV